MNHLTTSDCTTRTKNLLLTIQCIVIFRICTYIQYLLHSIVIEPKTDAGEAPLTNKYNARFHTHHQPDFLHKPAPWYMPIRLDSSPLHHCPHITSHSRLIPMRNPITEGSIRATSQFLEDPTTAHSPHTTLHQTSHQYPISTYIHTIVHTVPSTSHDDGITTSHCPPWPNPPALEPAISPT